GPRNLNLVAGLQVLEAAEDAALDVVVAVEDGVAAADGGGVGVVGDGVPLGDQHVAAAVDAPVEDRGVLDAQPGGRGIGDDVARAGGGRIRSRKELRMLVGRR